MMLKVWFLAARPWSFVMTVVSASLAYIIAVSDGLNPLVGLPLYLLTLLGLIIFHAATNMANDYFDVKHGVDRVGAPTTRYRPHPLITGQIDKRSFATVIAILYVMVFLIAGYLAMLRGPFIIALALTGFFFSLFYTSDPISFKYKAFGEPAVFLVWGPLMVGGAYYVMMGVLSPKPLLASIPIGLLVAMVLLANNIRDIDYDGSVGITTLATLLGRERSVELYRWTIISVYLLVPILVAMRILTPFSILTFLTLPQALSLIKLFKTHVPEAADPLTAQLTLKFGIMLIIGEILGILIPLR